MGCAGAGLGLPLIPAHAANPLPAPQTLAWCQLSSGATVPDPVACNVAGAESASVTLLPGVLPASNFDAAPGFDTIASLTYAFMVVGGHNGDRVPLLIDTRLGSTAVGSSFAAAGIVVTTPSSTIQVNTCTNPANCAQRSFAGTLRLDMLSGQTGTIDLVTQAAVGFLNAGPGRSLRRPVHPRRSRFPGCCELQRCRPTV